MKFEPRQYQGPMIEHELLQPRVGLWAGTGTGKTSCTLRALDNMQLEEPGPSLVLGPRRVAQSTWPDEAAKWDNLKNIVVQPVVGTPKARAAALKRDASVYTTNYENLPWLVEHLGDKWPFRTVVADESPRLKGFRLRNGGMRAQALGRVAHKRVRRWVNLTGLVAPNGVIDLWGQSWFLDEGQRLGRTFGAFKDRWFTPVPRGGTFYDWEPLPHAQAEVTALLRDLCLSIEAGDHFKLPPLMLNTIYVDLPPRVMDLYKRFEREMYAQLDGADFEAFNAAGKSIKCLQLANGAAYIDDDGLDEHSANTRPWREVHDVKLQAVQSVITEAAGQPVMVAYHFKPDLVRLQRAFPQGRVLDLDPQTIRDWNARRIPILFAHPESAGEGLNLQDGGHILVFFAHWWALSPYAQIIERLGPTRQAQAGRTEQPVYVHHIVARGTVDEKVMARRVAKRAVNDAIHGAMKRG